MKLLLTYYFHYRNYKVSSKILRAIIISLIKQTGNLKLINLLRKILSRREFKKCGYSKKEISSRGKLDLPLCSQQKTAYTKRSLTITLKLQNRFAIKCGKDCSISKRKEIQKKQKKSSAEWMLNLKLPMTPWEKRTKFSIITELPSSARNNSSTREELLKLKWWKSRFMPSYGNLMLKESLKERCKRLNRNKKRLRILWPCLIGRETHVRFRDNKRKLD